MKTTKTLALLLLAVAAGSAWAQQETLLAAGQAYTLTNEASAIGANVTYQWFRNDVAIQGATSASYNLPNHLTYGYRVEFKRGATSPGCGGYNFSNAYMLTFYAPIGGVSWMTTNLTAAGACAERPDAYGGLLTWNYPDATTAVSWTAATCPAGWRVPTQAELLALRDAGSAWAGTNSKGNAVPGRFFGPNYASCNLTSNMSGCIFLPAAGYGNPSDGTTIISRNNGGYYWCSTPASSTNGYDFTFGSGIASNPFSSDSKGFWFSVRCVQ